MALERPDLTGDEDFFDAGGDSLRALELLFAVEQRYGVRPRVSVLFEARTAPELFAALALDGSTTGPGEANRALVVREGRADGQAPPLWLVPGAGGVPLVFQPLTELLDPDLRILSIEFPGTKGEREPLATVEEIATVVHRSVVAEQPTGPYRLLGYSVGGLVALEVARRLQDEQREVELLMAIESGVTDGSISKGMRQRITAELNDSNFTEAGRLFGKMLRRRVTSAAERVGASVREATEHVAINRYGLRPSDRLVFERMLTVTTDAGLRYRPGRIDVRVVLVLGEDGGDPWAETLTRLWGDVADRGVELHRVTGSHSEGTTLTQPHVGPVAGIVAAELGSLDAARSAS
jgi:thioesterase domain-containing protein/acyl carrier protein